MMLPTLIYWYLCLEFASLHVARSGRSPKVTVEFASECICSAAKEMSTYERRMQPSMCLGCWNSAVRRNSLLEICERCMFCQLLSHPLKKKTKQKQTPQNGQWNEVIGTEQDFSAASNINVHLQSIRLS